MVTYNKDQSIIILTNIYTHGVTHICTNSLACVLLEIANTLAIYLLVRMFRNMVQFHSEMANLAIQAIPKFFLPLFLNIFLQRKKLIVIAGENVNKMGQNTPINVFYMDKSKKYYYVLFD